MKALKNFIASVHFLTLLLFVLAAFILSTVDFSSHKDQTIGTALASITPGHSPFLSIPVETNRLDEIIADNHQEIRGRLNPGDTLARSFNRSQVPPQIHNLIVRSFRGLIDFNTLMPGDSYSIVLDENGNLVQCYYESGPFDAYSLTKNSDGGYLAEKIKVPLECKIVKLSGTIESTLFAAFPDDLENPKLIYDFADIFASRIDFNTETRNGDKFSLVVEKFYKYDDFVGFGKILTARYEQTDSTIYEGFYFASEKTAGGYYDRQGNELGTSFLRSPVPMGRVTSKFTLHRMHPILGVVKSHLGVDLAAAYGTPVMAAGDGKILRMSSNGGFGLQIVIAHGGDYKSYYGHLSKLKKGLQIGSKVKKKDIIGYVGSTGLATGPHLDYRIQHHDEFKNPFALKFKPKSVLTGEELARLQGTVTRLAALLKSSPVKDDILQVKRATISSDYTLSTL